MTAATGCAGAPDLCTRTAVDLAGLLARGEVSAVEALETHLGWIDRRNPELNAICTLDRDHALEQARAADALRRSDPEAAAAKPLLGLPTAVKDLVPTKGIRTTFGSPIFADNVPDFDALIVERIRDAGAVVLGKTNTPEFGAGSQTFNPVFGKTRNPWDPTRTCGGSSGGAAAALASGMLPIADGSDLGGSLRNPASFCGVVGFRPTPGRVPRVPPEQGWDDLAVLGPMGRNVADAALLFSVIAGPDPRDPISLARPSEPLHPVEPLDLHGLRLAWTPNLGLYPVEREVVQVCEGALPMFRDLGADVEEAAPDLSGADGIFRTLRANLFADKLGPLLPEHRQQMKDTVIEEIERGLMALTGPGHRDRPGGAHPPPLPRGRVLRDLRRAAPAGRAGPALRRRPPLSDGDRRPADDKLHGLDGLLLLHHRHRLPGHLRPLRSRPIGPAGGPADRHATGNGPPDARHRGGVRGRGRCLITRECSSSIRRCP